MSLDYIGDPDAIQSPSSQPGPAVPVHAEIPLDLETLDAASVTQAFKVLSDNVAWLNSPIGRAILRPIWNVQNARKQARTGFDHLGLLSGRVTRKHEHWHDANMGGISTLGSGIFGGPWKYSLVTGGTNAPTIGLNFPGPLSPATSLPSSASVVLNTSAGTNVCSALIEAAIPWVFTSPDLVFTMELDVNHPTFTGTGTEFVVGMQQGTAVGSAVTYGTLTLPGFAFYATTTDSHWKYVTRNAAGAVTFLATSTSLTATASTRLRMDVVGANAANDSNPHVYFWINGTDLTDVAVDMTNGGAINLRPFFRIQGADNLFFTVGAVHWGWNTATGNKFL